MRTFIRYLFAGLAAVIAHYIVLVILVEMGEVNATVASASGFCVGVMVNYKLQYHWTFRATGPHSRMLPRYLGVTLVTLGINTGIFWILYELLGLFYPLAQAVAIGVVFFINFVVNRRFTFKSPATQ